MKNYWSQIDITW